MAVAQKSRIPADFPIEEVAAICKRWGISRLELFGSRARGDHHEDSDYDFLYSKAYSPNWGMHEFLRLAEDLETLLQRPVHLVHRPVIEESRNPYRRESILEDAIDVFQA